MNHHPGFREMYLMDQAHSRPRFTEPQAEAPCTAKRIAMKALRRQSRQTGTL